MASFPSAIWTPTNIGTGTILAASLFQDAAAEIDAIEAELGVNIHGTAGSLAERVDMFMDDSGGMFNVKLCDASDGQRRRCRAGVEAFDVADMTISSLSAEGTVTFSPPLAALRNNCFALLELQLTDQANLGDNTIPSFVSYINGSGTTTSFRFRVGSGNRFAPSPGHSFLLHWFAIEASNDSSNPDLP